MREKSINEEYSLNEGSFVTAKGPEEQSEKESYSNEGSFTAAKDPQEQSDKAEGVFDGIKKLCDDLEKLQNEIKSASNEKDKKKKKDAIKKLKEFRKKSLKDLNKAHALNQSTNVKNNTKKDEAIENEIQQFILIKWDSMRTTSSEKWFEDVTSIGMKDKATFAQKMQSVLTYWDRNKSSSKVRGYILSHLSSYIDTHSNGNALDLHVKEEIANAAYIFSVNNGDLQQYNNAMSELCEIWSTLKSYSRYTQVANYLLPEFSTIIKDGVASISRGVESAKNARFRDAMSAAGSSALTAMVSGVSIAVAPYIAIGLGVIGMAFTAVFVAKAVADHVASKKIALLKDKAEEYTHNINTLEGHAAAEIKKAKEHNESIMKTKNEYIDHTLTAMYYKKSNDLIKDYMKNIEQKEYKNYNKKQYQLGLELEFLKLLTKDELNELTNKESTFYNNQNAGDKDVIFKKKFLELLEKKAKLENKSDLSTIAELILERKTKIGDTKFSIIVEYDNAEKLQKKMLVADHQISSKIAPIKKKAKAHHQEYTNHKNQWKTLLGKHSSEKKKYSNTRYLKRKTSTSEGLGV